MRPETLNPLFIETDALDGVGPKLRKPLEKLGLERVKDIAYHLPDRFVLRHAGHFCRLISPGSIHSGSSGVRMSACATNPATLGWVSPSASG